MTNDNAEMLPLSALTRSPTLLFLAVLLFFAASVRAQSPAGAPQQAAGVPLPLNADGKKVDEFLATLRPPTNLKSLISGNDLLLEFPAVTSSGPVRFRVVSTVPRTDGLWVLSLHSQPDSGAALFASVAIEPSAFPEASLLLNIEKTQPVLLVVRSSGKYYGLQREIKVGQTAPSTRK